MNHAEEINKILDKATQIPTNENASTHDKTHSDQFLAVLKDKFKDCIITINNFRTKNECGRIELYVLVRITLSKAARIRLEYYNGGWRLDTWSYISEKKRWTRCYSYNHSQADFPIDKIDDFLTDKKKEIINTQANIVPHIIRYLKKEIPLPILYRNTGCTKDSFNYRISVIDNNIRIVQKHEYIEMSEVSGTSVPLEMVLIADPQSFDKIKKYVVKSTIDYYNNLIKGLHSQWETVVQRLQDDIKMAETKLEKVREAVKEV